MRAFFIMGTATIILLGCGNKKQISDGYGNFVSTEIMISSETSGKILVKNYTEGSKITAEEIVYVVDTVQLALKQQELISGKNSIEAKKNNLLAQIAVLEEQRSALKADLKRFENMYAEGAASRKQLDDISNNIALLGKQIEQVRTNFASVNAEVGAIEASLAQTGDMIKRSIVRAPSDGTILETYGEPGETTGPGKPLFKIANLEIVELKAYFSGNQLAQLRLGDTVSVFTDNGNNGQRTYQGIISWIAADAEFTPKIIQTREERVSLVYAVKIKVDNDGFIKLNMPGEVKLSN
jgi:HlyD family secretion protein